MHLANVMRWCKSSAAGKVTAVWRRIGHVSYTRYSLLWTLVPTCALRAQWPKRESH